MFCSGWLWRTERKGISQWYTNQIKVCTRARHRFHFLYRGRRRRFYRICNRLVAVPRFDPKTHQISRTPAFHIRSGVRLLRVEYFLIPCVYQCGDGARTHTGDRYSLAVFQLRRFLFMGIHAPIVYFSSDRCQSGNDPKMTYRFLI